MKTYTIKIKKSAKKDLDAVDDKMYIRIDRNIQRLINDPFPRGVKKLRGAENEYRIRVWKYRKNPNLLLPKSPQQNQNT